MTSNEKKQLALFAADIREGIVRSTHAAKSGHPGGSLSATEYFAYLYSDDLLTLRKIGSYLQGHPNMNMTPGVDMSTGSLGQGISAAVGMAKAAKFLNKDINVYTLLGDGEVEEGQVWEAVTFAVHYKLDNLCIAVDVNGLQIDGSPSDDVEARQMIKAAYDFDGPMYIRFGRMATPVFHDANYKFEVGKGELIINGLDVAIVATGILVTVEEHNVIGGLGEAVCSLLAEKHPAPVKKIGVNDEFGHSGAAGDLLKQFGLCADNIVKQTESMVRDNVV